MKKLHLLPLLSPFLFAAYPVVFLFAGNIKTLQSLDLFIPLVLVEIITLVILFIFRFFYRDIYKAAIVTSYILIVSLSYKYIYDYLGSTFIDHVLKGSHLGLSIIFLCLGVFIIFSVWKSHRSFHSLVTIFSIVSFTLLVFPIIQIFQFHLFYTRDNPKDYTITLPTSSKEVKEKPDIYYFIFDRYARTDTLAELYSFDNTPFERFLTSKGFYIANQSQANYIATDLSLASSLNGSYLDGLIAKIGSESSNLHPLNTIVENYAMMRFLKSEGYLYIHFGSWWSTTSLNRYADSNINILSLTEFGESIFNSSILSPIAEKFEIPLFNTRYTNWKRVVYQFDKLNEIPKNDKPTFVFAHFLLPHPPYVFDAKGNFVSESVARSRDNKDNFTGQVTYANTQIEHLINTILSSNKNPKPIIIIQADEGPYPKRYDENTKTFDWSTATVDEKHEKMRILNAYYLPNGGNKLLYPTISPVNTFRTILNYYFGQNLPYLPNISYYSNKGKLFYFTYIQEMKNDSIEELSPLQMHP